MRAVGWAPGQGGSTAPASQGEVRNCCGKSKTGNTPPKKPLAPLPVLSASSQEGRGGMEVAGLSWSPAKKVAGCRGCASEASAEGASPAQGPAVSPGPPCWRPLKPGEWGSRRHLSIQTSERALATGLLYSLIFTTIFSSPFPLLSMQTRWTAPCPVQRTEKRTWRDLQISPRPRQESWAGGEHCPTTLAVRQAGHGEDALHAITKRGSEGHSPAEESNVDQNAAFVYCRCWRCPVEEMPG